MDHVFLYRYGEHTQAHHCVTVLAIAHFEIAPTPLKRTGSGAREAADAEGVARTNGRRAVQRLDRLALLDADDDQVERYALRMGQ